MPQIDRPIALCKGEKRINNNPFIPLSFLAVLQVFSECLISRKLDNLNVFRQQNFLPVFYQKKAGDMPLAISSPHQHHALLCTLVCYGFRLLSLYIGHMLSNVNGPFSYVYKNFCHVCFQFPTRARLVLQQKN